MRKLSLSIILSVAVIFSAVLFYSSPDKKVFAEQSEYVRIINEQTPFYKNVSDSSPLFMLPYTYYVKVLGEKDGFYHVECFVSPSTPAIDGFVPDGLLFTDGLAVINPYPNLTVTSSTTAVLYSDQALTSSIQYIFADRSMRYYGSLTTEDGILYYVGYNGKLGYVKESSIYPFSIPNHPNELTFITPELPSEDEHTSQIEQSGEKAFSLKVIIIGCLMFAGIVALFVIFKQRHTPTVKTGYYDENEYE
ncbi:MAG: hypothetical protein E7382_05590 [Clostridiales bacterium]|nr:hypothetical protein [Clostridiales bacterium]